MDPRDQLWQLGHLIYRVYFHTDNGPSDECKVTGGDVDEVMARAEAKDAGHSFVRYACVPHDGLGLVRLMGADPNGTGVTLSVQTPGGLSCLMTPANQGSQPSASSVSLRHRSSATLAPLLT